MFNLDEYAIYSLIPLIIYLFILLKNNKINLSKMEDKRNLLIWAAIIIFLTLFYAIHNKISLKQVFLPFQADVNKTEREIILSKAEDNHFYISLTIVNKDIIFLVDTGASTTTLSLKDAKKLNIPHRELNYSIPLNTANGRTFGADFKLKEVKIDEIIFNDLNVIINKSDLNVSLMGMNFLKRFKSFKFEGNKLILIY